MPKVAGSKIDTSPLLPNEYALLRTTLPNHWRIFYDFLWMSGVRCEEALLVVRTDLIMPDLVMVEREKRSDHRKDSIPVPQWLWNEMFLSVFKKREERLWPYTRQAAWAALRVAAGRAGVRSSVHPHSYRHGFGRRIYKADDGLSDLEHRKMVQEALGHSSDKYIGIYGKPAAGEVQDYVRRING